MADILTYVINVAAPAAGDVVQRELVVTVNGEVTSTTAVSGSTVDFGTVSVPQNSDVVISVTDVDDAGNKSQPAVVNFVATDTIAPDMPGGVTVTLVGESHEQGE